MAFLIASGSVSHAFASVARVGSIGTFLLESAPEFAPLSAETAVFSEENEGCSNPTAATGKTRSCGFFCFCKVLLLNTLWKQAIAVAFQRLPNRLVGGTPVEHNVCSVFVICST